jgi:hypothetical protein
VTWIILSTTCCRNQSSKTQETTSMKSLPSSTATKNTLTSCTGLVTGEHVNHRGPSYTFKSCCCWSEVPGGSLLFTGGAPAARKVGRIDTRREFTVAHCPPMLTPRGYPFTMYPTPHLYILGGWKGSCLSLESQLGRSCGSNSHLQTVVSPVSS